LDYFQAHASSHMARPGFGMPRIHAWVMRRENYWPHEIRRLRATLQQDAAAPAAPATDTRQDGPAPASSIMGGQPARVDREGMSHGP
ncbi:MAG TPA: hypothetical protein VFJ04_01635, partial [Rhodanobacteraceae bacterium]|nr:hypothetical protein [Rhodanobacteraceae bacterium]